MKLSFFHISLIDPWTISRPKIHHGNMYWVRAESQPRSRGQLEGQCLPGHKRRPGFQTRVFLQGCQRGEKRPTQTGTLGQVPHAPYGIPSSLVQTPPRTRGTSVGYLFGKGYETKLLFCVWYQETGKVRFTILVGILQAVCVALPVDYNHAVTDYREDYCAQHCSRSLRGIRNYRSLGLELLGPGNFGEEQTPPR